MKHILLLLALSTNFVNAQLALPYTQDFEGVTFPPTGCQFFGSSPSPTWLRSSTVGGYSQSSACMYFDNFTTDNSGGYFGIRMPSTNFTGITAPAISFDVAYARYSANRSDQLGLYYSLNGTSGWTTIINYINGTLTTAPDQTSLFTPDSTQWETKTVALPTLANLPPARLAFENNSDHGNVMYIDNVNIFDQNATGVNDASGLSAEYRGYPNPANDHYYLVHSSVIEKCAVKIFDVTGREMQVNAQPRHITINKVEIDVEALPTGIYFLQVETERGFFCKKVSVVRG